MEEIILSTGSVTIVDDELFIELNKLLWKESGTGYACRSLSRNSEGKRPHQYLHDVVLQKNGLIKGKDEVVDHINRNKLDNRKSNLRIIHKSNNAWNIDGNSRNKSGVRGVCWCPKTGLWRVQVCKAHVGRYKTLEEAKVARDRAAIRLKGEL